MKIVFLLKDIKNEGSVCMLKEQLCLPCQMHLSPLLPRIRTHQEEIYLFRTQREEFKSRLLQLIKNLPIDEFHLHIRMPYPFMVIQTYEDTQNQRRVEELNE